MNFPDVTQAAAGTLADRVEASEKLTPALALVADLCRALTGEGISCCHWKSNNALDRSASGENDLDLLVSRADLPRFTAILSRLEFKQAIAGPEKEMIGVMDYYGHDRPSGRLIHVHAHCQLVMGHDMTKNYRLPVEAAYLDSATQSGLFRIPAAEFEYIVLVIRMVLKHATWDVLLTGDRRLKKSERSELDDLQGRVDPRRVRQILEDSLPFVSPALFEDCAAALQPGASLASRGSAAQQLQHALEAQARLPLAADVTVKMWNRLVKIIKRRFTKSGSRHRLAGGGAMIAIVGGDGAGKTTAVDSLYAWLRRDFDALRVHMGKPPESAATRLIRALLRLGQLIGLYPHLNSASPYLTGPSAQTGAKGRLPWMIREACKARDRRLTYVRASRFANRGRLVICDRFPLPQVRLMDGPVIAQIAGGDVGSFARFLIGFEMQQYRRITPPDLVVVLRLDPDEAVRRKTTEDPAQVRARSTEIWQADWSEAGVHVVDAGRSPQEVLSAVKSLVWSHL